MKNVQLDKIRNSRISKYFNNFHYGYIKLIERDKNKVSLLYWIPVNMLYEQLMIM